MWRVESVSKRNSAQDQHKSSDIGKTFGIRIGTTPIGWRNENPGRGDDTKNSNQFCEPPPFL
jgi:hypothetical protein